MRTLLKWLGYLVLALALLLAAGWLLPSRYAAQRSVVINAPPDKVWPLVAAPKAWTQWTVWNRRDPAMQVTYSGPDSGPGAGWSWVSKSEGIGHMQFTKADPPVKLDYTIGFGENDRQGTGGGSIILDPEGAQTKVTWTMSGNAGNNPVMRWFGLFIDKLIGPDFEAGLANLKALAEKG
ncbi:MAG: SRPBCC family protein [Betaproteobacteria bacterium]|nr:SRPBCC family protein [Betaproteobacteria bacterium]